VAPTGVEPAPHRLSTGVLFQLGYRALVAMVCAAKGSNLPPRIKSPVLSHSASSAWSHPPVSNRTPPTYRVGALPDELGRRGANERPRTAYLLHGKQVLVLMSFIRAVPEPGVEPGIHEEGGLQPPGRSVVHFRREVAAHRGFEPRLSAVRVRRLAD
jgi:hypothetical protein